MDHQCLHYDLTMKLHLICKSLCICPQVMTWTKWSNGWECAAYPTPCSFWASWRWVPKGDLEKQSYKYLSICLWNLCIRHESNYFRRRHRGYSGNFFKRKTKRWNVLILFLDHIWCLLYLFYLQSQFNPRDVPYRTMRTMSNSIMNEMLPGEKIYKVDLHEGTSIGWFGYFLSFSHFTIKFTYITYISYCTYNTYSFHFQNWMANNLLYFTILTRDMPWNGMLVKLNLRISSIISMNVRSRGHVLVYAHSVVQMGMHWYCSLVHRFLPFVSSTLST